MANYGPPAPFQIPHLPPNFIPHAPTTGYLAVAPGYALPSVPHGHYYQDPGAHSQQPAPPTSAAHSQPQTALKKVINSFTTTFANALDQLVNTNLGARTQITIMHVIDMKEAKNVITRGKKHTHHRNLEKDLKCETHEAAKEIAMGRATIWNPPSGHDFEQKPKRAKHSASLGGARYDEDKENAVPGNCWDLSSLSNLVGVIDKEGSKEVNEENFDNEEDNKDNKDEDEYNIFRERSQFVPEFE
ncbi:hypothetical protein C8J56DRAFT_1064301 [Mycena floridula]|nr:hypothetical protein C8J56DRAFT_1064301 [Mycena floridula]